jgi:hypothetical protein
VMMMKMLSRNDDDGNDDYTNRGNTSRNIN